MEYKARNYNQLSPMVYHGLIKHGVHQDSRNGPVLRFPEVVTLTVTRPWERVNRSPLRDANPFFHFVEAMAMLTDVNSVKLMTHFAKNMANFTDDGKKYNAFYGTRAIGHFSSLTEPSKFGSGYAKINQVEEVIKELSAKPDSRQALIQLWDPVDLQRQTKDKACNLSMLFEVFEGHLRMTTFNRSNDAIWGICTGANIVHLSFFQEYIAARLRVPIGSWSHVSNNLHVYTNNPLWPKIAQEDPQEELWSSQVGFRPGPLAAEDLEVVRQILTTFLNNPRELQLSEFSLLVPLTGGVLIPLLNAHTAHRAKDHNASFRWASMITDSQWSRACVGWLSRREPKLSEAEGSL